jgi:acetate kinase
MSGKTILALNGGSSSLKFGLFDAQRDDVLPICSGSVEGIGSDSGRFSIRGAQGETLKDESEPNGDQQDALRSVAQALDHLPFPSPAAVGHRIVHGGPHLRQHQRITPEVLRELETAAPFAPLHVPAAVNMVRQAQRHFPGIPQFACFDTAFHRTLPESAARLALPEKFWQAGVRRYGFHGLSCESILHALASKVPDRLIVAHLGSGASITAIANGSSVDTTMGLTPTGGIVMSTRSGDLDPGVLLYMLRTAHSTPEELEKLLDKESGLLGISGISGDMRRLHEASDHRVAHLAIEIFCRTVKKAVGAFMAVLGGLDLLVLTGGIGEHDADVRSRICSGLGALGIIIDPERNQRALQTISASESRVRVCVMVSDEDKQIARHTYRLLNQWESSNQAL